LKRRFIRQGGATVRLDFSGERVLAVVAHPDDAELLCAGTLARAARDGAEIGVCVLCLGDKGQTDPPTENLVEVRRREMQESAAEIGAALLTAGIPDSTLADDEPSRWLLTIRLREFRPTLVLGHAAHDYHADHRAASRLVDAASWMSASPGQVTKQPRLQRPPAVWWMDTIGMHGFQPGFFVDVSDFVGVKERMLGCHASQLRRAQGGGLQPLLEELRSQMQTRGRQAGVVAAEAFALHQSFGRTRAW
jgi:LmbE family N-acetylglucosaminyl deacetylase